MCRHTVCVSADTICAVWSNASSVASITQDTLSALGINVDLGISNIVISNALVEYASDDMVTPEGATISQGLRVKGAFTMYDMSADVDFAMSTDGVQLITDLDISQVLEGRGWGKGQTHPT